MNPQWAVENWRAYTQQKGLQSCERLDELCTIVTSSAGWDYLWKSWALVVTTYGTARTVVFFSCCFLLRQRWYWYFLFGWMKLWGIGCACGLLSPLNSAMAKWNIGPKGNHFSSSRCCIRTYGFEKSHSNVVIIMFFSFFISFVQVFSDSQKEAAEETRWQLCYKNSFLNDKSTTNEIEKFCSPLQQLHSTRHELLQAHSSVEFSIKRRRNLFVDRWKRQVATF